MNIRFILVFALIPNISGLNLLEFTLKLTKKFTNVILENSGDHSQCTIHLKEVIKSFIKRERWGIEMIDATAKLQSGLFEGNIRHIGNFDECLAINKNVGNATVKGKYCSVLVTPSKHSSNEFKKLWDVNEMMKFKDIRVDNDNYMYFINVKVSWDICIPASCSSLSLQKIWDYTERKLNLSVHLYFDEQLCSFEGKPLELTTLNLFAISFFGIMIVITLVSTTVDICFRNFKANQDIRWKLLTTFSFYTNFTRLIFAEPHSKSLSCINGIRVLSMFGIILSHRFLLTGLRPNINGAYLFQWKKNVTSIPILASFMLVDTFFAISGLLVMYIFLRTSDMGIKITTLRLYAHRLLRLAPSSSALVIFYIGVLKFLATGPVWPTYGLMLSEQCKRSGLYTLFYLNNYVPISQQCTLHLWYLSLDTQMFFLAPIILFNIKRRRNLVLAGTIFVLLSSMVTAFILTRKHQFGVSIFQFSELFGHYIYESVFVRSGPWLVGIIFGYFLHQHKNEEILLNSSLISFLWICCGFTLSAILYAFFWANVYDYNVLLASLINSLARPLWGLCICWIIFACINGYGGILNKILSLEIFTVFARLNYAMYLVHLPVQMLLIFSVRTPGYISNLSVLHDFFGDVVAVVLVAIFWNLTFESPIMALEKIALEVAGEKLKIKTKQM